MGLGGGLASYEDWQVSLLRGGNYRESSLYTVNEHLISFKLPCAYI